jgi:AcrR family transcriptional regulator
MTPRPDVTEERRAQIIEAALALFTRQGYANTTVDDIATESGLSKGAIYWYFDSKHDLFQATASSVMDKMVERSLTEIMIYDTATERLRVGARCLVDLCRDVEGYFGLVVEFWTQSDRREEVTAFWAEMINQYREAVEAIFEAGVRNGEFKSIDTEALAWMVMAAYDGLAAYHMMMPDIDVARISEGFIEALLGGVKANGELD